MGLRILNTNLSLQGALSGASDISSADVIKKFSLGGFSDSGNGISNNAIVAPVSYVPNSKNSNLYAQDFSNVTATPVAENMLVSEPQINQAYAVSAMMPEPLAIFSFTKSDIPSLNAAIYQAYFEDKCSLEFSKALLKKAKLLDEKSLSSIVENVKLEIESVSENLSLVDRFLNLCMNMNASHNSLNLSQIVNLSQAIAQNLKLDKIGLQGRGGNDPISLLNYAGGSKDILLAKSNTTLLTQLMYLAAQQMSNGVTSKIVGSNIYDKRMDSKDSKNFAFVDTTFSNNSGLNLRRLSLSNNTSHSFLYGISENIPYTDKLKMNYLMDSASRLQKSAYLMAMLANEMSISTGLGMLDGTSLGQAFGSTGDYRQNFWGANVNIDSVDSTTEASVPGSLTDFFIVNSEGSNRLNTEAGVLLFDGSRQPSTSNRKNLFDAFLVDAIRSPLNPSTNKVQQISDAHQAAIARFDLGTQFFQQLHCRNEKVKLMTPRGLYTRLLEDFSNSLSLLQSESTAKGQQVQDLCILSVLVKNPGKGDVVKRSLLSVMAKKAMQIMYNLQSPNPQISNSEAQKSLATSPTVKTTVKKDGVLQGTYETTVETVESQQKTANFNPNLRIPRFCVDENDLFNKRLSVEFNKEIRTNFSLIPAQKNFSGSTAKFSNVRLSNYYNSIVQSQDGFLDKLVRIYVDMCAESSSFLAKGDKNASAVDANRLTKNSQLDAAMMLALLLEAGCLLAGEFVNAGLPAVSGEFKSGVPDSVDIIFDVFAEVGSQSKVFTASQALIAICKASNGNDFSPLALEKNGNQIIPEVGSLSRDTPISYGNVTISSIVETFHDLAFERDLPALCLSVAKSMIQYFDTSSVKYKDTALQLVGSKKQTDDSKKLISFAKSVTGEKFFSSLNDFSLDSARRKLNVLQQEINSESGRIPKLSLGELRCVQAILSSLQSDPATKNFIVLALPKDFVIRSINSSYSVSVDRNNRIQDETMMLDIEKIDAITRAKNSEKVRMMIRSPIDRNSFSVFETRIPTGLQDILSNVILDTGDFGSSFLQKKVKQDISQDTLINEIFSYLLKKMFSVLSSVDLFSDNISDNEAFSVDKNSANTAKIFASSYGLSQTIFDNVFTSLADGTKKINEDNLIALTVQDFDMSDASVDVMMPPLKFGEAELFYDLFETVYFQSGVIEKRVFSIPLLDETVGFLAPSFDKSSQNLNGLDMYFNTYSVSVSAADPLVNQ